MPCYSDPSDTYQPTIDKLTDMLCKCCLALELSGAILTPEIKEWWDKHKEWDKKRKENK